MKCPIIALALFAALGASAQSARQNSMLETFVKYASINSQSNYDSICTQDQHNMALALRADVEDAIAKSKTSGVKVELSDANYLYVTHYLRVPPFNV